MENNRIKEITAFVNDFNKRLELSEEEQLIKESTMRRIQGRNRSKLNKAIYQKEYSFSHKSKNTKKKFELNKDYFKPLLPWVPNSFVGDYFNKFEKLNDAHNITTWEKVNLNSLIKFNEIQERIPLIKRTYEKPNQFLNKKNFICKKLYNDYLDKNPFCYGYDINKTVMNLTQSGKSLMKTFIEQNKKKEEIKEEKENKSQIKFKKKIPIWQKTVNRIEYFGGPLIDYKYEFIKPKSLKYCVNQPPFRRPKEKGDYLNKDRNVFGNS